MAESYVLFVQRIFVVFHSVFLTIQIVEVEDVIVDVDVFAIFIKINVHALAIFLSLFFRNNLSRGRTKKSRASCLTFHWEGVQMLAIFEWWK